MRFILIRHGQTRWNLQRRIQGWCDSELTQDSIAKLKKISLPELQKTILYTSDLGRATQTAEIIANLIGVQPTLEKRLRERKFGALEGKVIDQDMQLCEAWRAYHQRYKKKIGNAYGFESEDDFEHRILSFISMLNKHAKNSDIVIISHGEWIRAFSNIVAGTLSWHYGRGVEANGVPVIIESDISIN